jgi:hypothetical protein
MNLGRGTDIQIITRSDEGSFKAIAVNNYYIRESP